MIELRMRASKWRIRIVQEEWEFSDLDELRVNLNKILEMKEKFGQLKNDRQIGDSFVA